MLALNEAPTLNRHTRRSTQKQLQNAGYFAQRNGITHAGLTAGSHSLLTSTLRRHGNNLSAPHEAALMALVGLMTKMAQGELRGRWAFGLSTGMGKTSAVVAWITTLHRFGLHHVSCAVSASRVEALCQMKRDLMAEGVPEKLIGLIHSYKYAPDLKEGDVIPDGTASLPSTGDNDDRPFMLVTHARVRHGASLKTFNTYNGRPRDLLVYDESLIVSDSTGLSVRDLRGALGYLAAKFEGSQKHEPLIEYLTECQAVIDGELTRQKQIGATTGLVRLPNITQEQALSYRAVLGRQSILDPTATLLDLAQHDLRVVSNGQGGVVHYQVAVPPELRNIIVLDASYPIRSLVQIDSTIKDAEKHLTEVMRIGVPLSSLKCFDNVTIHQLFAGGGRDTMRQDFDKPSEQRKVTREVAEVIKTVPADEAVLVFVFKDRGGEKTEFRRKLLDDLKATGVDTEATIQITENGKQIPKPRLNIITWGMETSLNCFAFCQNVVLVGVLQRSPVDLAGAYLGQSDDLLGDVSSKTVSKLALSEVCHVVYQALSRGSCRVMDNGRAKRMTAWLIHRDASIRPELNRVMPGAVWKTWVPVHGGIIAGVTARTAAVITDYLNGLSPDVTGVSVRELKKATGLGTVPNPTFHVARDLALTMVPWGLEGRSIKRLFQT